MPEHHPKVRKVSASERWIRIGVVALGFVLRTATLQAQGLWRDEVDQWRFATAPWEELITNFTRAGWNGPLYSPLLRGWIALAGDSVVAMRYLSVLWGVLSIALLYALAERLLGHRQGRWAAGLLALSPYAVWYAQEIKMYTWVPLLVLLALYALDRACYTARPAWWLVTLAATSLAFYSHIVAALLIPVELGWFLLHPRRHPRAWVGGVGVGAGLVLPYVPLLVWQAPLILQSRQTGYPDYSLGQMVQALLNGWTLGIHQAYRTAAYPQMGLSAGWTPPAMIDWMLVIFYVALAAVGGWACAVHSGRRRLVMLLLWLWLPLVGVWALSQAGPIFTDRYLIWSSPALYILVGAALSELKKHGFHVVAVPLAAIVVVGLSGVISQATTPIKPQFDQAARYLRGAFRDGDLLLFQIPYNRYVLEYYIRPDPAQPWADAPYTNRRAADGSYEMDMEAVAGQLGNLTRGYRGVWLVYSEATLWDERELVRGWLDLSARLEDRRVYQGVELRYYGLAR